MTKTTIRQRAPKKNAPTGDRLTQEALLAPDMEHLRKFPATIGLTGTQAALLVMAAIEALIQDPERHWLGEYAEDLGEAICKTVQVIWSESGPILRAHMYDRIRAVK